MSTDLLTICIPVYERYEYFEEAIQSVFNQTVQCRIIVSDNASSHSKFREYCQNHQIEYHRNEQNEGMFANWNKCITYCTTPFFMILGDDDLLDVNFVEEFVTTYSLYPSLDLYYTNLHILKDNAIYENPFLTPFGYFKGEEVISFTVDNGLGIGSLSMIYKKDLFINNYFLDTVHGSNDWLWLYSNLNNKLLFGNKKTLYYYRKHETSDSDRSYWSTLGITCPVIYMEVKKVLLKTNHSKVAVNKIDKLIRDRMISLLVLAPNKFTALLRDSNYYSNYYKRNLMNMSFAIYMIKVFLYNKKVIRLAHLVYKLSERV